MPIEEWARGDWMQTFTGRKFYPIDPRASEVDTADIAHALSLLCRYGGHVDRFYSVAEHCVLMSEWIEEKSGREAVEVRALALEALLHDATEAYCVDVPRPLKIHLRDYRKAEAHIQLAIWRRFGLPFDEDPWAPREAASVKEADTRILLDERGALMSRTMHAWDIDTLEPLGVEVVGWSPAYAEGRYLDRLVELGVELN